MNHQIEPRVSVGLPVYNGVPYVTDTINSLLNQTFEDFELIICDNASTDQTEDIVREFAAKDERIRYYRSERNMGATHNYRWTLELARGTYFKWLAADDVILPTFLARSVEMLDANPALCLAYSKAAFIDAQNNIVYHFDDLMKIDNWPEDVVSRTKQVLWAIYTNGIAANLLVFGLTRTEAMRTIRPLGNYFAPDFTIVTELALLGQIIEIPKLLSFYRRHSRSSSSYARPSAVAQQMFFDPSITNRLRQEINLRRRYTEVFRAISISSLNIGQKTHLYTALFGYVSRRVLWRVVDMLRYRLRISKEKLNVKQTLGVGRPWSEITDHDSE